MNEVTRQALLSALRSILIVVFSAIAGKGYVSSEMAETLVGAVMTIVVILWGVYDKHRSEEKAKAREAIALNVGIDISNRDPNPTPLVPVVNAKAVIESVAPQLPPPPKGPNP